MSKGGAQLVSAREPGGGISPLSPRQPSWLPRADYAGPILLRSLASSSNTGAVADLERWRQASDDAREWEAANGQYWRQRAGGLEHVIRTQLGANGPARRRADAHATQPGHGNPMTQAPDMENVVAERAARKRRSGIAWVAAGLIFAVLIAGLLKVQADVGAIQVGSIYQGKVIVSLSRDSQKLREALSTQGVNPDTIAPAPEKRVATIPGTPGAPGVGITRVGLKGDQLQVFYSDGTSQSVGPITGPRQARCQREGSQG